MNERIKAIGRQAGFAFIEDGVYGDRWYSSKCGMDASEFEKLADLIVRECAKIAVAIPCPIEEGISRQTQGHTWDMACVATGKAIKEHFGVTE